jgi:hypothetical protein
MDIDRQIDGNHNRRMANQARINWDRLNRRDAEADALVGELCREGVTIFYINVKTKEGRMTGKIREFSSRSEARYYLLRNNYV